MRKKENFESYVYAKYTAQTAKTYLFTVNNFIKVNTNASKYQYKDMVNYLAELGKIKPNVVTRNSMLCAIKKYYDYLIVIKQRNDHPCKTLRVKGENIAKRTQVQFQDLFTLTELESLLQRENRYRHLNLRNKLIISFLIYQGLSCEEITRINVRNVDCAELTLYIKPTKKLRSRTLSLELIQAEWLEEYIKNHRKRLLKSVTNRLLISIRGIPETVESIGGMLKPLKSLYPERALNAKTIRLSVIANWLNINKLPIEKVQYMAGHKWPSSTLRYKRIDLHDQREKLRKWHPIN